VKGLIELDSEYLTDGRVEEEIVDLEFAEMITNLGPEADAAEVELQASAEVIPELVDVTQAEGLVDLPNIGPEIEGVQPQATRDVG